MRSIALVVLAGCSVTGLQATHPTTQEMAPPFALPASDGATVALSLPAVLVFYRGHW